MTHLEADERQELLVVKSRAVERYTLFENVGRSVRRIFVEYWIAILAISLCVLVFVNGSQTPSLSLWLFALIMAAAAFLITFGRLYTDFKINSHIIQARLGFCPSTASPYYVRALFDGYAEDFDHHLMVELSYQVPNLLAEILGENSRHNAPAIADLGCGTGLCGPLFARYADELTGVDLSPNMIELAKRKNCYDCLVEADIVDFLKQRPNSFDVCVAADVLVYFGDLEPVMAAVRKALRGGGLFAFTVEAADGEEWLLQSTGRYAHSASYVKSMVQKLGFLVVDVKRATLRTQSDMPVLGDVWLIEKCDSH